MNLIAAQTAHIERILSATPYRDSNEMGDLTLLRRKMRTLRASRNKYRDDLAKMGVPQHQITVTMRDAEDMAILEYNADVE